MKATKIIVCSAAALGLFLTLLVSGGYLWLRTSLPVTDGTLVLPGLHHTVTVERGKAGIPHIIAADSHDAAFALGFVHAQDRLFQMEMLRRYGAGELAEWGGKAFVRRDRFMRTLGLAHAAREQWKHLDAATKAQLRAYADGVNAYIDHHSGALFFAYDFLPGPRRWRPVDSLVIRNLMALYLSRNARQELLHARLIPKLSPAERKVLFPGYPDDAPSRSPAPPEPNRGTVPPRSSHPRQRSPVTFRSVAQRAQPGIVCQ